MNSNKKTIIYTDLDGTLLDHNTYSFSDALPTLSEVLASRIPVVFCSSKTREEIQLLRDRMDVRDPFIIENGGAVIIPAGYFRVFARSGRASAEQTIVLGTPHQVLVEKLAQLQAAFPDTMIGFSQMTVKEVALDCGLQLDDAKRAKQREFDEPFKLINPDSAMVNRLTDAIRQLGLFCSRGGRYYHLHGHNDKGAAVRLLNRLFNKAGGEIFTLGVGDSLNDLPMLASVDYPILVRKSVGSYDEDVVKLLPKVHLADGVGPRGWSKAIKRILNREAAVEWS